MGLNSPSSMSATASPPNFKEKRNSVADSNTSNVSVGGASSATNSILVSPSKALFVHENNEDMTKREQQSGSSSHVSPSISIGEEALKTSSEGHSDTMTVAKNTTTKASESKLIEGKKVVDLQTTSKQNFCDPLLRRESESENANAPLSMPNIKDMNISKVVEKCQSST